MERKIHELVQGSPEWADFRLEHDGASEAAAMLGLSKNTTRTELLLAKKTGNAKEFSDFVQKRILDRGHEVEALARPIIEKIIGEELYPATVSMGRMSASCDGLSMDDTIAMEHKQWNAAMAARMQATGEVPDEHMPQCQQVLMVTGAEKLIFVMSDGTRENMVYVWVEPDPEWFARLDAGWKQFHQDLAEYQHVEVLPAAVGTAVQALPALSVTLIGEVTSSNLAIYKTTAMDMIAGIKTDLQTDQDFADADSMVKFCGDAEKELETVKRQALSQTSTIDELFRTIDEIKESMRAKRLELDKLVKARKESIRVEIQQDGVAKYAAHVASLNQRIGKAYMPNLPVDFAGAMRGKKTVSSLRDGVSTELARAKIAASEVADKIQANVQYLRDNAMEYASLFADAATIVLKAPDDLQALATNRINAFKAEEAKKEAAIVHRANCTARINMIKSFLTQAQAKTTSAEVEALIAQCDAMEMDGFVEHEAEAITARTRTMTAMQAISTALFNAEQRQADVAKATAAPVVEPVAPPTPEAVAAITTAVAEAIEARSATSRGHVAYEWDQPAASAPAPATPPTLRLGQIGDRLGFTVTADFMKELGFTPAAVDKRAQLFHEREFPAMCRALIQHIADVMAEQAVAA